MPLRTQKKKEINPPRCIESLQAIKQGNLLGKQSPASNYQGLPLKTSKNEYLEQTNNTLTHRKVPSNSNPSLDDKVNQCCEPSAGENIDAKPKRSYTTGKKPVFCGTD
jgi:hypothetical protein